MPTNKNPISEVSQGVNGTAATLHGYQDLQFPDGLRLKSFTTQTVLSLGTAHDDPPPSITLQAANWRDRLDLTELNQRRKTSIALGLPKGAIVNAK